MEISEGGKGRQRDQSEERRSEEKRRGAQEGAKGCCVHIKISKQRLLPGYSLHPPTSHSWRSKSLH